MTREDLVNFNFTERDRQILSRTHQATLRFLYDELMKNGLAVESCGRIICVGTIIEGDVSLFLSGDCFIHVLSDIGALFRGLDKLLHGVDEVGTYVEVKNEIDQRFAERYGFMRVDEYVMILGREYQKFVWRRPCHS